MPDIYHYLNYRHYLRDFYHEKKTQNPKYSYRVFNEAGGIKSPSFLKQVIENKRSLTALTCKSFVKALKLNKKEAQFFNTLVHFNQAKTLEEKNSQFKKITYFKEYNAVKNLEAQQYQFCSQWYNVAILEMTKLKNFKEDPRWIAERLFPPITPEQARESLQLLYRLGLVKKNERLRLVATDANIASSEEVFEIAVANFHEQMIAAAGYSLHATDGPYREISSVTLAVDEKYFLEAKRRIQEFQRELNVILSTVKEPTSVYQLNFQLFNLCQIPWKK